MKRQWAPLGMLVMTALVLAPACRNTAEGVKEDSRQNAEKARHEAKEGKQESQDVARESAEKAREAGDKVAEGAESVASEVGAGKQTFDVKAALMLDKSIDASHIHVETDADTKTVTVKGTVPTAAQKAAVEKLVRDKAEGYKLRNLLTVVTKS